MSATRSLQRRLVPPVAALSALLALTACTAQPTENAPGGNPQTFQAVGSLSSAWHVSLDGTFPSGARRGGLAGLYCFSTTDCVAVGAITGYDGGSAAIADWLHQGRWQVSVVPVPTHTVGSRLFAVSCSGVASCVAIGNGFFGTGLFTSPLNLVEVWDGRHWRLSALPGLSAVAAGNPATGLQGVSCVATGCLVVGSQFQPNGNAAGVPLAYWWNGSDWRAVPYPLRRGQGGNFQAVACLDDGGVQCIATGTLFEPGNGSSIVVVIWNGAGWRPVPIPPLLHGRVQVQVVSCWSASCVVVGQDVVGPPDTLYIPVQVLFERGRWTTSRLLLPSQSSFSVSMMSCADSTCVAAGQSGILRFRAGSMARINTATGGPTFLLGSQELSDGEGSVETLFSAVAIDCLSSRQCLLSGNVNIPYT